MVGRLNISFVCKYASDYELLIKYLLCKIIQSICIYILLKEI